MLGIIIYKAIIVAVEGERWQGSPEHVGCQRGLEVVWGGLNPGVGIPSHLQCTSVGYCFHLRWDIGIVLGFAELVLQRQYPLGLRWLQQLYRFRFQKNTGRNHRGCFDCPDEELGSVPMGLEGRRRQPPRGKEQSIKKR